MPTGTDSARSDLCFAHRIELDPNTNTNIPPSWRWSVGSDADDESGGDGGARDGDADEGDSNVDDTSDSGTFDTTWNAGAAGASGCTFPPFR